MITQRTHTSKLYGKQTLYFEIEDLQDLRGLKKLYPAIPLFKVSDGCTSIRSMDTIKAEYENKTVRLLNGQTVKYLDHLLYTGKIESLVNPYIFNCSTLRGYSNSYEIVWYTNKYIIHVKPTEKDVWNKLNFWQNVLEKHERESNEYAQNTVRNVKLIPVYPETLTKEINFNVIYWSGGNTTTYNSYNDPDYIKTFHINLFYGQKRIQDGKEITIEKENLTNVHVEKQQLTVLTICQPQIMHIQDVIDFIHNYSEIINKAGGDSHANIVKLRSILKEEA